MLLNTEMKIVKEIGKENIFLLFHYLYPVYIWRDGKKGEEEKHLCSFNHSHMHMQPFPLSTFSEITGPDTS